MAEFLEKKVGSMKEWDLVSHRRLVTQLHPKSGKVTELLPVFLSAVLPLCGRAGGRGPVEALLGLQAGGS